MTAVSAPSRSRRPLLSFSVEGLPARDELLLKSLVRLLDHRTDQHWDWRVENADLRVVGDRAVALSPEALEASAAPVPLLTIGDTPPPRGPFLRLPLHADALEAMLNRLGAMVVHARDLGLAASRERGARGEEFRLLRWPSVALLDSPVRLKLATLLASRPASLQSLQQRSNASAQECAEFVAALERAGFVATGGGGARAGAHEPARAPSQAAPVPGAAAPAAREPVQQGLLARIRSRLGLLSSARTPDGSAHRA